MIKKYLTIACVFSVPFLTGCGEASEAGDKAASDTNEQVETKDNAGEPEMEEESEALDMTDPASVIQELFNAAKERDYSTLEGLCDPEGEGDGDTKHLCAIASGDDAQKAEFVKYFENASVVGDPEIEGDMAKVQVKIGPDGTKDETMKLVKRGDNWYLSSF